jgi:hypothetical protein
MALISLFVVSMLSCAAAFAQSDVSGGGIQTGNGHHFVATDYSGQKVFIVGSDGKVEWEYATGTCNDVWALPNGNILFNTGKGVQEVTRDKKVVFSYESPSEIYACQRLANGDTFIGECNAGRLLEVDAAGKIVHELRLLPEGKDGGHVYMRNARKLANGNYLVALIGGEVVREYAPDGKVVWECPAPGGPHTAVRLPNGNTIISIGDLKKAACIIEVNPKCETVWKVDTNELPGIQLKFITGFQRLPNGNTVFSNWVGHGEFGKAPHIIEVTPDKKVLWTFQDHKTMKTVSSVQLLDVPGDGTKGDLLH